MIKSAVNNLIDTLNDGDPEEIKDTLEDLNENYLPDESLMANVLNDITKMTTTTFDTSFDPTIDNQESEKKSNIDISNKNKIFNEKIKEIEKQISFYESNSNVENNLNDLHDIYISGSGNNNSKIVKMKKDTELNFRKSYYESNEVSNVKFVGRIFNLIYYLALIIFIFYVFIQKKDYKTPSNYIIILLLFLLPIYIVPLFVKLIFQMYYYYIDFFDKKIPKDVFMNI